MSSLPAPVQLFQMITGFVVSQSVCAAAKLGIADLLAAGPRSAAELGRETGMDTDALYRLLRALATVGIFAEVEGAAGAERSSRRFVNTPMAEMLRSDVPGSQRAVAIMCADECYGPFGRLDHSLRTGGPAYDAVFGAPLFDVLSKSPERGRIFDAAMTGIHGPETRPMIEAYDFAAFERVIDIGGGNGSTLFEILRACPRTRGLIFDLPSVIERTSKLIEAAGLSERCGAQGGSFFESVPAAGPRDAYIMRHIIHDWDNERSVQILRRCREAAAPGARVLIVESVIPPANEPHPGKWLDMIMLAVPGGRERTAEEYRTLLSAAGLRLGGITPTASPVSVIEAVVE